MRKRYVIAALIGVICGFFCMCCYDFAFKKYIVDGEDVKLTELEVLSSKKFDAGLAERVKSKDRLQFKLLLVSGGLICQLLHDGDLVWKVISLSGLGSTSLLLLADQRMIWRKNDSIKNKAGVTPVTLETTSPNDQSQIISSKRKDVNHHM